MIDNSRIFIIGTLFSENKAIDRGGAINVKSVPIQIFNSTFDKN